MRDPVADRLMAMQSARSAKERARRPIQVPHNPAFTMPKPPTKDEMMAAFIEDRNYDDDTCIYPKDEENLLKSPALSGPERYDAEFVNEQLMREQPDEFINPKRAETDDADPLNRFKVANARTTGMMVSFSC